MRHSYSNVAVADISDMETTMVARRPSTRWKARKQPTEGSSAEPRRPTSEDHALPESVSVSRMQADLKMFKHIAEQAAEGIAVTDNDMQLVYINAPFAQLYGQDRDELLGTNPLDYGGLIEVEDLSLEIERNFDERGSWSGEITIERPDGSVAEALVSATRVRDDTGATIGRVALLTDVSEIKAVEAKLLEVNAALDAYAQTVSHDLRSPLACALLANEMMRDALAENDFEALRHEVAASSVTVSREIQKAYSLINDLLTLAESGQEELKAEDVDVAEVVDQVLLEHESDIRARAIEVIADKDFGNVCASRTHVYQLFSNLIANAIRHNDAERPVLRIRHLEQDDPHCHQYLISDNSSGISEEEIASIFKPLRKSAAGTSKGMGLAIVKKIVDVYGGSLRIYNEGGVCFEFEIRDVAR
jgi:PAS domain S-box-containing protein